MSINDPLDSRQPNPSSREIADRVQALKSAKQLIGISHVKSAPIVPNKKYAAFVVILSAKFNDGFIPL